MPSIRSRTFQQIGRRVMSSQSVRSESRHLLSSLFRTKAAKEERKRKRSRTVISSFFFPTFFLGSYHLCSNERRRPRCLFDFLAALVLWLFSFFLSFLSFDAQSSMQINAVLLLYYSTTERRRRSAGHYRPSSGFSPPPLLLVHGRGEPRSGCGLAS